MPFNISKNFEILPAQSKRQYSCFLTYDAESMARKLSNAYPVNWKIFDFETDKDFPEGHGSSLQYQMQISEGPHKLMILITPYSGNNIFSDYLDAFGEGFHHNCFMFDKLDEYKIQLAHLIGLGYSKVQSCSKQSVFESCILKHPEAEFKLELLFLAK
jgi:hypothetical protein